MEKGVLKSNLPIDADLERSWDLGSAIKRVKDWATSDGKIDYQKYSKAFLWIEGEGDKQEDYKLPFADVVDGEVKAIWAGVKATSSALLSSKSGVEMDDDGHKNAQFEIAEYYKKFDKEVPEFMLRVKEGVTINLSGTYMGDPEKAKELAKIIADNFQKIAKNNEVLAEKGDVADQLSEEAAEEQKMYMLQPFWEVIYAFCEVWRDDETEASQFKELLTETIGILQTVADGTYQSSDNNDAGEDELIGMALRNGVDKEQLENFVQSYIASRSDKTKKEIDPEIGVIYKTEDGQSVYGVDASYDAKQKIAIASTDVMDRQGERVSQEGWDLKNFKKNPLLLWGHDHSKIAVGNAKNIHIERTGGKPRLVFTPVFHDKTEDARALGALYEEGWMNSFSVGFIPKDMDGATSTYLKQELLEISACNVPANPEATVMAMKSLKKAGITDKTMTDLGLKVAPEKVEEPKVLDVPENTPDDDPNEPLVKAPQPAAPQVARTEQSLIKGILRATDKALLNEKTGQEQDVLKTMKIIKRAAEILSTSQRRKLEDGKTR